MLVALIFPYAAPCDSELTAAALARISVVLDEADQLLESGFADEVDYILNLAQGAEVR
jgi:hypothetical protein